MLLAGHTIINLDNCTLAVDGDFLCQVLTQPIVEVRKLGGHDVWRVPGSATILATGNSLVIAGDMTRRALVCNLDAGVERPELREFDFNPVEMAKRGRTGYLVDVLTILRAFHVAGSPRQAKPLGSFDAWSDRVRSALVNGVADRATMERTRKSDWLPSACVRCCAGCIRRSAMAGYACAKSSTRRLLLGRGVCPRFKLYHQGIQAPRSARGAV